MKKPGLARLFPCFPLLETEYENRMCRIMTDNSRISSLTTLEQALQARKSDLTVQHWFHEQAQPYQELMAYYRCAMMEVETKFRVLNEAFSLQYDSNPIETIKTRLKKPENIIDKLLRYNLPVTVESIENYINDVAGVRVICAFPSEIDMLAEALLRQDDVKLVQKKDYIRNPKESGYRSLHLIVAVPIFLHDKKRMMKVEVQFRTLAMDWWASLEHKLRYKKSHPLTEQQNDSLLACSEIAAELDRRMEELNDSIDR